MNIDVAALRTRYEAGASTLDLAVEVGLSRVQLWRVIGRPARYLLNPPPPPDPAFAAWAAGFFDGEGNVHLDARGNLDLGVSQTSHAPLFALQRAFAGTVRDKPSPIAGHRHQWRWSLSGQAAVAFLRFVRPRLLVKGPQADLAIAALTRTSRRGKALTEAELDARRDAFMAMKSINHRGRA